MGAAPESSGTTDGGVEGGAAMLMGDSKLWPPGFRFHPTDEELVLYYLKRKLCRRRIKLPMIGDVDVYKWEPWELPEKSVLRSRDKQWYFFSQRDRKYPNGSRSNRSTRCGYWKATGKDRTIKQSSSNIAGNKKTLVYYRGRPPRGERTDWVMHEYTLDEQRLIQFNNVQDSYALYKVFRKSGSGPKNGEQYGAPFREEEWDDNDDDLNDGHGDQSDRVDAIFDHLGGDSVVASTVLDGGKNNDAPVIDLEDLLLQMANEDFTVYQSKIEAEAEIGNQILGSTYIDTTSTQHVNGWSNQGSISTSFYIPQSTYTEPIGMPTESIGMPEVASFTNWSEQGNLGTSEEFVEIKDFIDTESPILSMDDISHGDNINGGDTFYDPYEYFNADMYLTEALEPLGVMPSSTYFQGFNIEDGAQDQINNLWAHERLLNASAEMELNPASGVVCDNTSLSNIGVESQGEINHAEGASESWLNSALFSLLDSIPSNPAIASENALISRALERVSSFRATNLNATGRVAAVGRRQGSSSSNRGFLFISLLVGIGAVLWVLTIGAAIKVLKFLWGKSMTS